MLPAGICDKSKAGVISQASINPLGLMVTATVSGGEISCAPIQVLAANSRPEPKSMIVPICSSAPRELAGNSDGAAAVDALFEATAAAACGSSNAVGGDAMSSIVSSTGSAGLGARGGLSNRTWSDFEDAVKRSTAPPSFSGPWPVNHSRTNRCRTSDAASATCCALASRGKSGRLSTAGNTLVSNNFAPTHALGDATGGACAWLDGVNGFVRPGYKAHYFVSNSHNCLSHDQGVCNLHTCKSHSG